MKRAGYDVCIEKGLFGARNIVIGDPDKAKVIYTAHYDTCAGLPFPNFITPKNFLIYFLYQVLIMFAIIATLLALTIVLYLLKAPFIMQIIDVILWVLILLMMFGPACKHTANDNTSGVTVIIDMLNTMPPEHHDSAAFIFFDLEEAGLWGSISYRLKHYRTIKDKLVLNFDCVSDGNDILIAVNRKAKRFVPILQEAFQSTKNHTVEIATKRVFYPSDQALFPRGVACAALKRTKWLNILYMNRIHTNRDTVYQYHNIEFLVNCSMKLIHKL